MQIWPSALISKRDAQQAAHRSLRHCIVLSKWGITCSTRLSLTCRDGAAQPSLQVAHLDLVAILRLLKRVNIQEAASIVEQVVDGLVVAVELASQCTHILKVGHIRLGCLDASARELQQGGKGERFRACPCTQRTSACLTSTNNTQPMTAALHHRVERVNSSTLPTIMLMHCGASVFHPAVYKHQKLRALLPMNVSCRRRQRAAS